MPDDRLFHPRMRRSRKVGSLNYLEKWVWQNMIFESDNYGVLPFKPAMLAGNDDSLEATEGKEPGSVRAAMDVVVSVGLFLSFEHQGQRFLCDPVWQDHQKIKYPKATFYPIPPAETFQKLSEKTQELFRDCHSGFEKKSSSVSRANHRLKAKANGNGSGLDEEGCGEEFDDFYTLYPRHISPHTAKKAWNSVVKETPGAEIIAGLKKQLPELKNREQKFIPYPATWLNAGGWKNEAAAKTSGRANLSGGFDDTPPGPVTI